jgi:formylglycine-generating enzyme required for sulfatase activity
VRQFLKESRGRTNDPYDLHGFSSQPAVWVDWEEAWAFCDWLTESWKQRGLNRSDLAVGLPSEAEWEKAARGGVEISAEPRIRTAGNLEPCTQKRENPWAERLYPWGNQEDSNKANFLATGIESVSPVGCFPGGTSPYGCEEMSGSVWEWTRSLHKAYPYSTSKKGIREREHRFTSGTRVLRGGSYLSGLRLTRCTARLQSDYLAGGRRYGFRVVLSPFVPKL